MPDRITTPRLTPRTVRPTAVPGAAYEVPEANPAGRQLAEALGQLVPSLNRFGGVLAERTAERQKSAGAARAREMAAQGKSLADAVRNGDIRPDENPWFRVGFYETAGRTQGLKYVGDFLAALQQSPVKDSANIEDYDRFEQEFRSRWVETNLGGQPEPFLSNAFGTTVDGQMAGLRNEFARQAGTNMSKQNLELFHSEIFEMVRQMSTTDLSASELGAAVKMAQDRQVATGGMSYDQANRLTASAVAAAAVRLRDTSVLDILDQLPTGSGWLGGTSYAAELREDSERRISQAIDDDLRREEAAQRRERTRATREITGGMLQVLEQDPGASIADFVSQMAKVNPDGVQTLQGVAEAVRGGVYANDPQLLQELTIGIFTEEPGADGYTTQAEVDRAFGAKRLEYQTYRQLSEDIRQRDEAGGSGRMLRNPILTDIRSETRRVFTSEFPDGLISPAIRLNAENAASEAVYQMIQWLRANPEAAPDQIETQKTAIRERVIRRRLGIQAQAETSPGDSQSATADKIKPGFFPIADPIAAAQMAREFEEIRAQQRNGFSPQFRTILQLNNIALDDLRAIQDFVREQTQWTSSNRGRQP